MRYVLGIMGAMLWLWAGPAAAEPPTTRPATTQPARADEAFTPTLVTLHVKNAAPQAVILNLATQTGVKINTSTGIWQNANGSVTLDVDRQPFWSVVLQVCKQAGLTVSGSWDSDIILNNAQDNEMDRPYKVEKQFVVIAKDAIRTHAVDYGAPADVQTSFNIHFDFLADPHLHVLSASPMPQVLSVRDDKGHVLTVPDQEASPFPPSSFHPNFLWNCTLPLKYRADIGKTMSIKALMLFQVVQRIDSWQIPNILTARNVSRVFSGGTYVVRDIQKSGVDSYLLTITVNYDPSQFQDHENDNPLISFDGISKAITLLDAKGRAWSSGGGMPDKGGIGKQIYRFVFRPFAVFQDDLPGPPATLVWKIPAETRQITVPVEFDKLVIP